MARNPLDTEGPSPVGSTNLRLGDTLTYTAKDRDTGQILRNVVLHRTGRPYVYDLCDAYNDSRSPDALAKGLEWEVMPNGELHLCFPQSFTDKHSKDLEAKAEADRRQWIHRQQYPVSEAAE